MKERYRQTEREREGKKVPNSKNPVLYSNNKSIQQQQQKKKHIHPQ